MARKIQTEREGYTTGQLLVSTPQIQMSCFHKSVIFMAGHGPDGAMGFIVNQPLTKMTLAQLLGYFSITPEKGFVDMPVYFGGPVDAGRGYVLHSPEYETAGTAKLNDRLSLTTSLDILKDLARGEGPEQKILLLGYSGWAPGQLEGEIEANSWFSVPSSEDLIFGQEQNDLKWLSSAKSLGIDPYRISDVAGHA